MHHGSHHLSRRIKENGSSTFFDKVMLVIGTAAAFMTLPQIISIWQNGPEGVSLTSWLAYTLHSTLWVIYGIAHRERIVIGVNAVWALMNGLVVLGLLALR